MTVDNSKEKTEIFKKIKQLYYVDEILGDCFYSFYKCPY